MSYVLRADNVRRVAIPAVVQYTRVCGVRLT
jgi:hypothetical protein